MWGESWGRGDDTYSFKIEPSTELDRFLGLVEKGAELCESE